jgi:uncharacterized membrane protein YdcZ (DUF606 family)
MTLLDVAANSPFAVAFIAFCAGTALILSVKLLLIRRRS